MKNKTPKLYSVFDAKSPALRLQPRQAEFKYQTSVKNWSSDHLVTFVHARPSHSMIFLHQQHQIAVKTWPAALGQNRCSHNGILTKPSSPMERARKTGLESVLALYYCWYLFWYCCSDQMRGWDGVVMSTSRMWNGKSGGKNIKEGKNARATERQQTDWEGFWNDPWRECRRAEGYSRVRVCTLNPVPKSPLEFEIKDPTKQETNLSSVRGEQWMAWYLCW